METSNIKLYPESNQRIADLLLLCEDNAMCIYAGTYIKSLEEQLKRYKGLEEQGKLLKLPCAVGDTVYQCMIVGVDKDRGKAVYEVCEAKVFKFSLDSYTLCFWTATADEKKYQNVMPLSAFGKTVFLTQEEAEEALKRMEDGNETN